MEKEEMEKLVAIIGEPLIQTKINQMLKAIPQC